MNLEDHTEPWKERLEVAIKSLKEQNPDMSENRLAQKIGVPRSTLNRLLNEELSIKKPTYDTYIKIMDCAGFSNMLEETELYDPKLAKIIKKNYEVVLNDGQGKISSPELEAIWRNDKRLFILHMMASSSNGVSEEALKEVFGASDKELIEKGISLSLIEYRGSETIFAKDSLRITRSLESVKEHLSSYAEHFKVSNAGKNTCYAHSATEGLNQKGVNALYQASKEFHKKVRSILQNEELLGDIPYFSVAFCDSFTEAKENSINGYGGVLQ